MSFINLSLNNSEIQKNTVFTIVSGLPVQTCRVGKLLKVCLQGSYEIKCLNKCRMGHLFYFFHASILLVLPSFSPMGFAFL